MIDQTLRWGTLDRIIEVENSDHFIVDLYPYKIKNRELFYDRNHPKNLNPYSKSYSNYWSGFLRKCIEGKWVLDKNKNGDSCWVYTPPKLFFYLNYIKIPDKFRRPISPRLRDNESIMATYMFVMDGFSGFMDDNIYTCNRLVKKIEDYRNAMTKEDKAKYMLEAWEEKKLEDMTNLKNPSTGQYKKYVDPWVYLTEHYLINHNQGKPLGLPLYDNNRQNAMIIAARACGKSMFAYLGDLLHEFLLGGIRRWEDIKDVNNKLVFKFGSKKAEALNTTLEDINSAMTMLPGKHPMFPKYLGSFAKRLAGGVMEQGKTAKHEVKRQNNTVEISGNTMQLISIKAAKDLAGGRLRRVGIEEVGFLKEVTEVFSVLENSIKVDSDTVGSIVCTGTGGEQEDITGAKTIYENPLGYNVAAMPDYYNRSTNKTLAGLFMSVLYQSESYKDDQGNTRLLEAFEATIKDRRFKKVNKDASSFLKSIMFNPLYPKEMLIPKQKNRFPTLEMSNFRSKLIDMDYLKSNTRMGWFYWDQLSKNGVRFDVDLKKERVPILEWGKEDKMDSLEGSFIMYEDVIENAPQGLYYVIVDPVSTSGNGSSQNSILVYKADYIGGDSMMRDTIVGEWTGRHESISDTYEFIVMISKYYNAGIFQETNVPYFQEWCRENDYFSSLVGEPIRTMQNIYKGKVKPSFYGKGVKMNKQLNSHAYLKLADWFKQPVSKDKDGIVTKRKFEEIPSLRILSEAIHFDPDMKTQFDGISSLYLLMLLKNELSEQELLVDIDGDDENGYYEEYSENDMVNQHGRENISFLDF